MNPEQSFLSMLGIARRAGKLVFGCDAVIEQVGKRQASLLILSCDLSERSRRRVLDVAEPYGVPCLSPPFAMAQFQHAIGRCTGILAVCDRGFANRLLSFANSF